MTVKPTLKFKGGYWNCRTNERSGYTGRTPFEAWVRWWWAQQGHQT